MANHKLLIRRAKNEEQGLVITCTKEGCDYLSTTHTITMDYFKVLERSHNDMQHELAYYPVNKKLCCGAINCEWEHDVKEPITVAEMNMLQKAHNDSMKNKR
jgi:hypothetical protein